MKTLVAEIARLQETAASEEHEQLDEREGSDDEPPKERLEEQKCSAEKTVEHLLAQLSNRLAHRNFLEQQLATCKQQAEQHIKKTMTNPRWCRRPVRRTIGYTRNGEGIAIRLGGNSAGFVNSADRSCGSMDQSPEITGPATRPLHDVRDLQFLVRQNNEPSAAKDRQPCKRDSYNQLLCEKMSMDLLATELSVQVADCQDMNNELIDMIQAYQEDDSLTSEKRKRSTSHAAGWRFPRLRQSKPENREGHSIASTSVQLSAAGSDKFV